MKNEEKIDFIKYLKKVKQKVKEVNLECKDEGIFLNVHANPNEDDYIYIIQGSGIFGKTLWGGNFGDDLEELENFKKKFC